MVLDLVDDIKVEIQLPDEEGDNLLTNTSGQYGAWQWSVANGVSGVSIIGDSVNRTIQLQRNATAGLSAIWTDFLPVTPGMYANARVDLTSITSGHKATLGLQFYDSSYGILSWSYSSPSSTLATLAFSSVTVPANAAYVRLLVILDKTADPLPDSGSANANAQATFTMSMVTEVSTAGTPSEVVTNLMPNGGFTYSTTGWAAGTNISGITRVDTGGGAWVLHAVLDSGVTLSDNEKSYVNGPYVGIVAGQSYSIRVDVRTDVMTSGHSLTPGLLYRWFNDSNVQIGADNVIDSSVTNGAWVQFWQLITAPAGATKLRFHPYMKHHGATIVMGSGWDFEVDSVSVVQSNVLQPYFDGDTPDTSSAVYAWTGTAGNSTSTRTSVGAVPYVEPDDLFIDITGGYNSFTIERKELDIGTLQGVIVDPAMSPARADSVVKPGRGIRVSAYRPATGEFVRLFTGKLGASSVEYDPLYDEDRNAVKINVTATDNASLLAQAARPNVTRTPANLPALVLSGAGVPWDVDGSSNITGGVSAIATNDSATALDQIGLCRDSQTLAYAWIAPDGRLIFRTTLGAKSTGPSTVTDADYTASGLKVSFSTDRLINSVNVVRIIRASDGSTEERQHGPYEDPASIREWGRVSQTVTIASISSDTAQADTKGASVLAANAQPVLTIEEFSVNSADNRDHAFHDLYDLLSISADTIDGVVTADSRVTFIRHEFSTDSRPLGEGRWRTTYGFMADGGVAAPAIQPPVTSSATDSGWTVFTKVSPAASMANVVLEYRITGGLIEWRTSGNTAASISVPADGNITNQNITTSIPTEMTPELGNWVWVISLDSNTAYIAVTPGGTVTMFAAEGTGTARTIASGIAVLGQSPAFVLP